MRSQCVFNGQPLGNILQINCDTGAHSGSFRYAHSCTQYADKCPPTFIKNWTTPLQQQSIQDYIDAGVPQRANSGGFFHSCYLGNMVPSRYNSTGQWQLLTINNVSMQQAVADWWASLDATKPTVRAVVRPASNYPHTHFDCVWNSSNPMLSSATDETRYASPKTGSVFDMVNFRLLSAFRRFQRFLSAMNATERERSGGAPAVPSYVNHYFCNPSCAAFRTWY